MPSNTEEPEEQFTDAELYAISLCIGWCLADRVRSSDKEQHRHSYAKCAVLAFLRIYGEGYHIKFAERIAALPPETGS